MTISAFFFEATENFIFELYIAEGLTWALKTCWAFFTSNQLLFEQLLVAALNTKALISIISNIKKTILFQHNVHIFHHLHGVAQLLQLSVFKLSHQLHSTDELCNGAVQASKQLGHTALFVLLRLKLHCIHVLFGSDGCNAGEGTGLTEQRSTLWFRCI